MTSTKSILVLLCLVWLSARGDRALAANSSGPATLRLIARTYNSGFALAHDTYNGLSSASDGKIYYVLSSESYETGAQMYVLDPVTDQIRHLGDITEACGEKNQRTIAQGKSHVNFVEANGKLYFATHTGYYSIIDGMEKMGLPPPGYKPYPGGHLLAYDLKSGTFENLGISLSNCPD